MRMIVKAYDESGNKRVDYMLEERDVVDWKRNGVSGFQRARVTMILERDHNGPRKRPIRIQPLDYGRERWIGLRSIMRVFELDGRTRKRPYRGF